jgi:ATP-dependent DNA helicase PIF1
MFKIEMAAIQAALDAIMVSKISSLRKRQRLAFDAMAAGKSIFITGPGGTGKTAAIRLFFDNYCAVKDIAMTSTTGTSAIIINGATVHSYLGIGLGTGSAQDMIAFLYKRPHLRKKWQNLDVLIVDEVSMLSPVLFDKLETIARDLRHNDKPFGGIQLILSGDFLQLPVVDSDGFCFQAESWTRCIEETICLDELVRQSDPVFQNCLNKIRIGDTGDDVRSIINKRIGAELTNEYGIEPTRMFALNRDVDIVNEHSLDFLAQDGRDFYQYDLAISVYPHIKDKVKATDRFLKNAAAPHQLQLCVGAQVMLLHNLDVPNGLANGSRGVVTGFTDDLPVVRFLEGEERVIDRYIWEVSDKEHKVLRATQIPLKPAYGISIHRSQGCSLDYAQIDLSNVFEYSMAYVALSRVRNLEGVSITAIDWDRVRPDPVALEYYEMLSRL